MKYGDTCPECKNDTLDNDLQNMGKWLVCNECGYQTPCEAPTPEDNESILSTLIYALAVQKRKLLLLAEDGIEGEDDQVGRAAASGINLAVSLLDNAVLVATGKVLPIKN